MNFLDTIKSLTLIIFIKLKFVKCYFEVNLSNFFLIIISGYKVYLVQTMIKTLVYKFLTLFKANIINNINFSSQMYVAGHK